MTTNTEREASPPTESGKLLSKEQVDEVMRRTDRMGAMRFMQGCGEEGQDEGDKAVDEARAALRAYLESLAPTESQGAPRVLDALEVLERTGYRAGDKVLVENFLAACGRRGLWVIENPLAIEREVNAGRDSVQGAGVDPKASDGTGNGDKA